MVFTEKPVIHSVMMTYRLKFKAKEKKTGQKGKWLNQPNPPQPHKKRPGGGT